MNDRAVRILVRVACAALPALLPAWQGCASLAHGSYQSIAFTSQPSGATVWIDSTKIGTTLITCDVHRGPSHIVRFTKDGFEPRVMNVDMDAQMKFILMDLLFWPGIFFDYADGAVYHWEYSFVNGVLFKARAEDG